MLTTNQDDDMNIELLRVEIAAASRTLYTVSLIKPVDERTSPGHIFSLQESVVCGGGCAFLYIEPTPSSYMPKSVFDMYLKNLSKIDSYSEILIDRSVKKIYSKECFEFLIEHEVAHAELGHSGSRINMCSKQKELEADLRASHILDRPCYKELEELMIKIYERSNSHTPLNYSKEAWMLHNEYRLKQLRDLV